MRSASGVMPVIKAKASVAWCTAMWPPSQTRQPASSAAPQQCGVQRAVDDVGHPQAAGAAARRRSGRPGCSAIPVGVQCTTPSLAGSSTGSLSGDGRVDAGLRAARRQLVGERGGAFDVDVDEREVVGAEAQQRVADRGAGAARADQHHVVGGRAGQPLAEADARNPLCRCCIRLPAVRRRRRC